MTAGVVLDVVLWLLVGVLTIAVLALARQVGVLSQRVAPAGALTPKTGPKIGELTEVLETDDLNGTRQRIGGPKSERTVLVLFISPTCPVCKALLPAAKSLATTERLRLVFASDGFDPGRHRAFSKDVGIQHYPYIVSQELGLRYGVSRLPFAVLIGADGVLLGRALVNTREHLESLMESWRSGVATLQDFVQSATVHEVADKETKETS
ncbi:MAG: thiol-disulfide isomerase [Gammaproteobacteria bacterium]|nr:thiol-disulfide isomerase [Gammaproteobacteria bacterium]MYF30326.1 thiol-disulfide isomerase [Gammaproteobacteria bacterium]MYK46268.1 thiol-disulfide isomerase [Gammaproteobacteria bacterium]